MDKLMAILTKIRPDLDFSREEKLMEKGILDSFEIITIIGETNEAFNININVGDLKPENFNSAKTMWELVCKYNS